MLVWYIACRCAMYQARLKSDDYTCRTVRKRLVDGGSNPPSSTIHKGSEILRALFLLGLKPSFGAVSIFYLEVVANKNFLTFHFRQSVFLSFLCFLEDVSLSEL
jgi:hypothetical protein